MRRLPCVIALIFFALAPAAPVGAQTLTTRDIVELTKAGLGEDILVALIEVNRSVFPVDRSTLASLKQAGVSSKVIVAMVRSGREQVVPPAPEATLHQDAVLRLENLQYEDDERERVRELERELERVRDREREREWEYSRVQRRHLEVVIPVAVPVYIPVPVHRHQPIRPVEPVYWGWGGKLRPDAWTPAETRSVPNDRKGEKN
ncbi:MAG: hypothetical protein H0U19_09230 [Acidobacteria bacterium]|nr:hypothetical protein [Acidobacteriota bacterium]